MDKARARARLLKMCSARHRIAQTAQGHAKHEAIAESEALRALLAENERLEKRLQDFLNGYHGASESINRALGTNEEFEKIDRELWEAGVGGWHHFVVEKVGYLKAEVARLTAEVERLSKRRTDCDNCEEAFSRSFMAEAALAAANERAEKVRGAAEALLERWHGGDDECSDARESLREALRPESK